VPYLDESYLDEQRERRRLAANYAGMTDGELQRLARNVESLTELAWDALEDRVGTAGTWIFPATRRRSRGRK